MTLINYNIIVFLFLIIKHYSTQLIDFNKLTISERESGYDIDNYISYSVGVIYIELDIYNKKIILTNKSTFDFNMLEILPIICPIWKLSDNDISFKSKDLISININYDILINYLSYIIIYD